MKPFPGLEHLSHESQFRSLGGSSPLQPFGAGFMNKNGVRNDNLDLLYPHYVIVYVLQGRGVYIDDHGHRWPLGPGDFFQRLPDRRHSNLIEPDSDWRECYLVMSRDYYRFCRPLLFNDEELPVAGIGVDGGLVARMWRLLESLRAVAEEDLPALVLECFGLAVEFHRRARITRSGSRMAQMINLACDRLGRDFQLPVDLEQICREHGCGYESFRKKFRQQVGASPGQYRIRRRLDTACELLNSRRHTIGEVAWMLGYSSPAEFSAQFKRHTGFAPTHFRGGPNAEEPPDILR